MISEESICADFPAAENSPASGSMIRSLSSTGASATDNSGSQEDHHLQAIEWAIGAVARGAVGSTAGTGTLTDALPWAAVAGTAAKARSIAQTAHRMACPLQILQVGGHPALRCCARAAPMAPLRSKTITQLSTARLTKRD